MNYQLPTTHSRRGFTLIEILVTITIVAMVGVIASSTLFSLFRGASKSEMIKEVKQNGDLALSAMEQKVRNALDVVPNDECDYICDATGALSPCIGLDNADGSHTVFSCNLVGGVNVIGRRDFTFPLGGGASPTPNPLTNNLVTVTDCTTVFRCTENTGEGRVVDIQFDLVQSNASANAAETATSHFQTSVTLRN